MKQAVMYGAGNIGRGFIGQLFHMSGYEITFVDVNRNVIDRLNADRGYPIYITEGDRYREYSVTGVRAVDGFDTEAIANAIAQADVMATAVGVNVLERIAAPIAAGVRCRMERGVEKPLNIIVCENKIEADRYLAALIRNNLSAKEQVYFNTHIATVEPSIGRMVPVTPRELAEKHPLAVCVEPYCELPVDQSAFLGELPPIAHLQPFSPFDFHIRRKLFMHNMSHALAAYLGAYRGYTYIWEAAEDRLIREAVRRALGESAKALSLEYGVPLGELVAFGEELIERFRNRLLGDTIERVGRDTKRKLAPCDRFVGAARLCEKHRIAPAYILVGIAAGLCFAPAGDEASLEIRSSVEQNGVCRTLEQYCEIREDSPFAHAVGAVFGGFSDGKPLEKILPALVR